MATCATLHRQPTAKPKQQAYYIIDMYFTNNTLEQDVAEKFVHTQQ